MSDIDFRMSPEINEIAGAIAKAQAELENVDKAGVNPAFRAAYVKLGSVLDEVRPKFAKHGIAITQIAVNGEGSNVGVITLLAHTSGQWLEGRLYVAPTKFDAQGAGSAITYCRRYSLMAMAGVAPDDDDGNASVSRPERSAAQPAHRVAPTSPVSDPFADEVSSLPPNGRTTPAAAAVDPDRKAKRDRAVAIRDRIRAAIEKAAEPKLIYSIVQINAADLAFVKSYHEPSYDALMQLATARTNKLVAEA